MINVAANVAAHQSSKTRRQPSPQPVPVPANTPVPALPIRPQPSFQQVQQNLAPPPPYGTHPLSHLTDSTEPSMICLHIACTNPRAGGFESAVLRTPFGETLYTISYEPKGTSYDGSITRLFPPPSSLTQAFSSAFTGHWKRHSFRSKKLELSLPWEGGTWGFDPDKQSWLSDVGLLPNYEFKWVKITHTKGYMLKCFDLTTGNDICRVLVESKDAGRILIPMNAISKQEQLDELVAVAMAVDNKVWTEMVSNGEAGSLKKTFEGINGVLGAAQATSGGGGIS